MSCAKDAPRLAAGSFTLSGDAVYCEEAIFGGYLYANWRCDSDN